MSVDSPNAAVRGQRRPACVTQAAALCAVLLGATDAGAQAPRAETCPGAAAWYRSHPATDAVTPTAADAAITDPELLVELRVRVERDQSARRQWLAQPRDAALARSVDAIDAENHAWLQQVVTTNAFPTAAQVGREGVHLAWVLLQHADRDRPFQQTQLPILEKRFADGELPANDLARMTDRILLATGKPQRYGTQFDWFAASFQLPDGSRLAEIDAERAHLDLMPLADYACTIRQERENVLRSAGASKNDVR